MADIGATLRETRIRDKIDITAVEQSTKIRAKYLRALENEEWAVLPGPAYITSFLRTYAEFLGLDAHMLVEEYRARFEQPEELELPAFAPNHPLRRRVRPPGPPSRAGLIVAVAVALLGVLFVLGITGNDGDGNGSSSPAGANRRAQTGDRAGGASTTREKRSRASTGKVLLSVVPARDVWVCLLDAGGRKLIEGRILGAGDREGPFKSARFRITVGNGGGDFRVNGKRREVPDRPTPLGYAISSAGTRLLPEAKRPTCAANEGEAGGT